LPTRRNPAAQALVPTVEELVPTVEEIARERQPGDTRDRNHACGDDRPTPRSMSTTGLVVHVWRKACRHARDADLAALIAAGRGDRPLVRIRMALRELPLAAH
jgi:hypothetical protein